MTKFTIDFGLEESVVAEDVDISSDLQFSSRDATRYDSATETIKIRFLHESYQSQAPLIAIKFDLDSTLTVKYFHILLRSQCRQK